jgi:hypothetical protein
LFPPPLSSVRRSDKRASSWWDEKCHEFAWTPGPGTYRAVPSDFDAAAGDGAAQSALGFGNTARGTAPNPFPGPGTYLDDRHVSSLAGPAFSFSRTAANYDDWELRPTVAVPGVGTYSPKHNLFSMRSLHAFTDTPGVSCADEGPVLCCALCAVRCADGPAWSMGVHRTQPDERHSVVHHIYSSEAAMADAMAALQREPRHERQRSSDLYAPTPQARARAREQALKASARPADANANANARADSPATPNSARRHTRSKSASSTPRS